MPKWPLKFKEWRLIVNANTMSGGLTVKILEYRNMYHSIKVTLVKGFTRGVCTPFENDLVRHTVAWKNGSALDRFNGNTVKRKSHLRGAERYSL